ncbi:unnamed protein product [marine sediment metagenome]|uniref:Uncharacterized protein n=1 Tax=marine sediment metagenome TaxID=412755 RepID=X1DS22_9ZZZZ
MLGYRIVKKCPVPPAFSWPPLVSLPELFPDIFDDYDELVDEGYWHNGVRNLEENSNVSLDMEVY